MKKSFFTIALLLLSITLLAQSSAVFTQVIPLETKTALEIKLDKPYTVRASKDGVVRIETNVRLNNGGTQTLKHLNEQGQYLLRLKATPERQLLTDNSRRKMAAINGTSLIEEISYVIYLPEDLTLYQFPICGLIAGVQ